MVIFYQDERDLSLLQIYLTTKNTKLCELCGKMRNTLQSIIALRCPSCHDGHLFVQPKTYALKKLGEVHDYCPVCKTHLKPEPGFYFGSAYVNWGFTVALWVAVYIALKVLAKIGLIHYSFLTHPVTLLLTGMVVTLLVFPYMFRVSRATWAHIFIKKFKIDNS